MQITIQSLEVTYNKIPYRFIVKKVVNTSRNEISFHCWAPEDNPTSKDLINNEVLLFEWDQHHEDLRPSKDHPVSQQLKQAIRECFSMERA
ncbi:MAG TPA: hypothetical protein VF145_08290 [Chitinophagaceae bacterium]